MACYHFLIIAVRLSAIFQMQKTDNSLKIGDQVN